MSTPKHQADVQAAAAAVVAAMDAFNAAVMAASKVDPDFFRDREFSPDDFMAVAYDFPKQFKKFA